jgi:choline dehydrogenase-like flavoprotein
MIRSGETLADGGTTEADIAIVGGGAMGIALAVRLSGRIGRIVLIEAGGAQFKSADNLSFFKAERVDDPRHAPTELYRRRMLGGTTSVWGGRCIPFDREDFTSTLDRPGWPLEFAEVNAYVPDALEFLDAGKPEFSAAAALPDTPVPLDRPLNDLALDRIERYSKPTDLWRKWRNYLTGSSDVTVIQKATCTGVLTNAEGTRAAALEVRTPSHRRHKIVSETIVLACGGFETPRLLLASRATCSRGLGNERDLVGRFYMTHLVSSAENVGVLRFALAGMARAFDFNRTADGVYARRMILLSPEARRREGLPNVVFRPSRPPMDDASHRDSVLSAMFLARSVLIPPEYARSLAANRGNLPTLKVWREHGGNVVADVPSVFRYRKDGRYPLEFNAEQMPNPASRVTLGDDTDALGMPRLVVQWRYRETELDAICRAYRVLTTAVAESGLGEIQVHSDLRDSVRQALVPQGGHHIGTVRMSADASAGVVDANCEVWGIRGLLVAGAAVLPTSGFANPTLTALALAFRLAEHLIRRRVARLSPYVLAPRPESKPPGPRARAKTVGQDCFRRDRQSL